MKWKIFKQIIKGLETAIIYSLKKWCSECGSGPDDEYKCLSEEQWKRSYKEIMRIMPTYCGSFDYPLEMIEE